MGGNATKDHNPQRLNTKEAMEIGNLYGAYLRTMLRYYNENPLASVIKSYGAKDTHGDIDVLVNKAILKHESVEEIVKAVSVFEGQKETFPIYKNSDVISIANYLDKERTKCFQVDLIFVPEETFNFAYGYFAYNDLGNLVGRVAHNMGLKFGHDGLWYPFRGDENYLFKDILITSSFPRAMDVLGFDIDEWNHGFIQLEEIFEYVCRSDYFNRSLYPLEHRSHKARIRDRKRKTYTSFLKYLDDNKDIPDRLLKYPEDKSEWLPTLFSRFPEFEVEYREAEKHLEISRIVKQKFNGSDFTRISGLEGKELGMFIRKFREYQNVTRDQDFKEYIYNTPKEHITQDVMIFNKKYVNSL